MNIAVIGPGAMGMLFGGYLSKHNEVLMVGRNRENMNILKKEGIVIQERDGSEKIYRVDATADTSSTKAMDLVLLFVKAGASKVSLDKNKNLIGENTVLLTLQNGAGHENLLKKYAEIKQILIGTTLEGSRRIGINHIYHSAPESTTIGSVFGDSNIFISIAKNFETCGLPCHIADNIQEMVWSKLMINASSSFLSALLQTPQGYVLINKHAWEVEKKLITEICAVANADGYPFDAAEQIKRLKKHLSNAPDGVASMCVDISKRQLSEVDVINGYVVEKAHQLNVPVPTHELLLALVYALQERNENVTCKP